MTLNKEQVVGLKSLLIARKITLNYDYCLDEEEADKAMKKVKKMLENKYSENEIKEACSVHSGSSISEIESDIARTLSEIL